MKTIFALTACISIASMVYWSSDGGRLLALILGLVSMLAYGACRYLQEEL